MFNFQIFEDPQLFLFLDSSLIFMQSENIPSLIFCHDMFVDVYGHICPALNKRRIQQKGSLTKSSFFPQPHSTLKYPQTNKICFMYVLKLQYQSRDQ